MTRLTTPITRETASMERGVPILIELHPTYAILRLKGSRHRYTVSYDVMYWQALRREAERQRVERAYSRRRNA